MLAAHLECCEEEVIVDDSLTLLELVLGPIKVIVHKKVLEELGDGIRVPEGQRARPRSM